ncbi:MAG: hypothetical protein QM535_17425 [Limnohabitans sp.]|nr:hypothetical protein [Limnohabitans sp.]
MSKCLKESIKTLEVVSRIRNKKIRESVLHELSDDDNFFNVLREIVENTLRKNIPIKSKDKKALKKHKGTLLEFVTPNLSKNKKRKLIKQSGGFLPLLVPLLTSFLSSVE